MGWDLQTIKQLFDLRKEDYTNCFFLFLYLFLIIASLMLGKTVSTALFISAFGALQLPYVIIGQTILITFLIAFYLRLARSHQPSTLISVSLIFLATNALLLWLMLSFKLTGIIPILYIWSGIFGVIAPMQVWVLANYIFTTRDARQYFGFIGSGGLLGFIFGGYLSKQLAPTLGAENLLPFIAVFCGAAAILVQLIWQRNQVRIEDIQNGSSEMNSGWSLQQSARSILESRYLLLITALVTIASLATKIVDVQFSAITEKFIQDKDEITAFFGSVYTYMGWGAFFLQLFLGGRMLDKLGIGVTILILPVSLLTSSLAALLFAALWTAVLLRLSDQVFKHSIDKSTTELLYLPIPTDIKFQVKSFIDTVVLRAGDGLAALLLLLFTNVIPLINRSRPGWISLLNIPVILLLLYVALQIRKEYVNALRPENKSRGLDPKTISQYISEPNTVEGLKKYLASPENEEILYALEMMSRGEQREDLLLPQLKQLINHSSSKIRLKALQLLFTLRRDQIVPEVEQLLDDPEVEIRAEAARYVYTFLEGDLLTRIRSLPDYPHHVIQGGVLLYLLRQNTTDNITVARIFLDRMIEHKTEQGQAGRVEAARILGLVPLPATWHECLIELLQDNAAEVINQALASAGQSQELEFVPHLLAALGDRRTKVAAREALAQYGSKIFSPLQTCLHSDEVEMEVRRNVPRVLSRIGGQQAVDILLAALGQSDVVLRYKIIKALNRLRAMQTNLLFDEHAVMDSLSVELEFIYRQCLIISTTQPAANSSRSAGRQQDLLTVSLLEQQDKSLERVFRLMGLIYPAADIHHAYFELQSPRAQVRANTIEFLDNLLNPTLRKLLLPLIDGKVTINQRARKGRVYWKWDALSQVEALTELLSSSDRWVRACAIYAAGQINSAKLSNLIQALANSPDTLLQETARLVMKKSQARFVKEEVSIHRRASQILKPG